VKAVGARGRWRWSITWSSYSATSAEDRVAAGASTGTGRSVALACDCLRFEDGGSCGVRGASAREELSWLPLPPASA
jgi:hypothetical protein